MGRRIHSIILITTCFALLFTLNQFPTKGTLEDVPLIEPTQQYYNASWINLSPTTSPSARHSPAMSYDGSNDKVVIFGGSPVSGDTWAYNLSTNSWDNRNPSNSPSSRADTEMVYDSNYNLSVLYGGWNSGEYADTWVYNYTANSWTDLAPSNSPGLRRYHKMVYNVQDNLVVLFGGYDSSRGFNDLWSYDYFSNTWSNITPSSSPSDRLAFGMSYDERFNVLLLFGGLTSSNTDLGDTWIYNFTDSSWTQIFTSKSPDLRAAFEMKYSSKYHQHVLFGGRNTSDGTAFSDTWIFDVETLEWEKIDYVGPARHSYRMEYDYNNEVFLIYGGYNSGALSDIWSLELIESIDYGVNSIFQIDTDGSNSITVNQNLLRITANAHSYAHIQKTVTLNSDIFSFSVETRLRFVSGDVGASFGPGIGLWWDDQNSIQFSAGNQGNPAEKLRTNIFTSGNLVQLGEEVSIGSNWIWLRFDLYQFNATHFTLNLIYSLNGYDWQLLVQNDAIYFNSTHILNTSPLLMLGKGVQYTLSFADGTKEFDTNANTGVGTSGISEFEYLMIGTNNVTSNSTFTQTVTETVTENATTVPITYVETTIQNVTTTESVFDINSTTIFEVSTSISEVPTTLTETISNRGVAPFLSISMIVVALFTVTRTKKK